MKPFNPHFIDLVICMHEGHAELYRAPEFSYLKKGDKIYVEGQKQDTRTVYNSITIDTNRAEFDFIVCVNGLKEIKRVIAKVETIVNVFEYEEE